LIRNLKGAGESGKSTIAKQMKLIYLNGFSEEDRSGYKSIIHHNIITSIKALVEAASNMGLKFKAENQVINFAV
jgi:guanine nucleotide-binding protein G(i) subunit alpha